MAAAAAATNAKNDEDGRNDSADYEKQRNMQRMYMKERRKREKEAERKKNPEDVTVPPASRWLPTGTWSKFSRQQGTTAATKGWKKAAGGGPAPACGGSRSSGGEARPDEDKLARIIDKSHRVWRQNVPLLYEQMMIQPLDQSSLTVQWMPEVTPVLVEVVNPDRTAIPPGLLMQHKVCSQLHHSFVTPNIKAHTDVNPPPHPYFCLPTSSSSCFSTDHCLPLPFTHDHCAPSLPSLQMLI